MQQIASLLLKGVFLLIITSLFFRVEGLVPSTQPYFLWPNPQTGEATVYFKNGNSKPVETLWVGYAAWKDSTQVKSKIKNLISRGIVPFIQSYHFGDNGLRGQFELALEFDKQVAGAIGNSFAIINLEPEWDVDLVLNLFKSSQGTQSLLNRIQQFNKLAPNSVVVSTPGLWKPSSSDYSFFSSVDSKLNARAMLMHVVNSGDASCARKQDGSLWPYGVKSLSEGISMVKSKIDENLNKMKSAWGGSLPFEWILSDVGITSCGWGADGQAQIVNELVKSLDCSYASGFRGFNLRNSGPGDLWERAMGVNNEGMFTFTTTNSATMNVINNGLIKMKSIFINGQQPSLSSCNNGGGSTGSSSYKVSIVSGSNDWWTQIEVLPTSSVQSVVFKCGGAGTTLERPSWSPTQFVKGLSQQCPIGSNAEIIVNSKFTYPIKYNVGASASSGNSPMSDQYPQPFNLKYSIGMTHTTRHFARFSFKPLSVLLDGEGIDMAVLRCANYGSTSLKQISSEIWEGELKGGSYCPIGTNVQVLIILRSGHIEKYNLVYGYNDANALL